MKNLQRPSQLRRNLYLLKLLRKKLRHPMTSRLRHLSIKRSQSSKSSLSSKMSRQLRKSSQSSKKNNQLRNSLLNKRNSPLSKKILKQNNLLKLNLPMITKMTVLCRLNIMLIMRLRKKSRRHPRKRCSKVSCGA
jgi:hypothetical protein